MKNPGHVYQFYGNGYCSNGQCCYDVEVGVGCGGRPFLVDGAPRVASAMMGHGGWRAPGASRPKVEDLDAAHRVLLAEEWTRDALFEHASIASFGRFALELLAAGAPADLVEAAHRAALDEVKHARLCFELASAYAGAPVAAGALQLGGHVEVTSDLADLAVRCAREGAVGETIAAVLAEEQLACATDPAVRAVLAVIQEEETRHAELAWLTLAWALREGGHAVRDAVGAVFRALPDRAVTTSNATEDICLLAHGRVGDARKHEAMTNALREVVLPAAHVLLAAADAHSARGATASPASFGSNEA